MAKLWQGRRREARGMAPTVSRTCDQSARMARDFENASDFQNSKKRLTSVDEN
jgi:hypothetical protein